MAGLQSGKRNVFRLPLNESKEGFCRRGRERAFHVDCSNTEKAWEPRVESLVRGTWRLRVSEAEFTVRHFDVTNISHYVTPRDSSWPPAPSVSPPAVSGTPPRPPPARDPGSSGRRTGSA